MPRPLLLLLLLWLLAAPATAAAPRRIVSMDLCTDQLVLALADPGQIAGLSRWARDPAMSYYAARARRLPGAAASAEEVLLRRPDLVLGAPFRMRQALAPLASAGVPLLDVAQGTDLAGIEASIRQVARAVGHPARGEALIAAMARRLAEIGPPPGRARVAADYQRQGYLTGTGTLMDDLMRRVGLVNLATRLGRGPLTRLSLEQLAMARPAFLIEDPDIRRLDDEGSALLRHPLLDRIVPRRRRLLLPGRLTVCPGPGYADAALLLANEIRAADRALRYGASPSLSPSSGAGRELVG